MGEHGPGAEGVNGSGGNGAFIALRSAPLPTWREFEEYERILPGLADRIVRMAETAQQARVDADVVPIRAEARAPLIATIGVTFAPWITLLAAVEFALHGVDVAAWIAGVNGALGGGAQIIQATRRPRTPPSAPAPAPALRLARPRKRKRRK